MKGAYKIAAVVAVVAVVCVAAYGFLMHDQDNTIHGEYSFGYTEYKTMEGKMLSESRESVLDLNDLEAPGDLNTIWGSDMKSFTHRDIEYMRWLVFYIDFYSEPGVTVNVKDVKFQAMYELNDGFYCAYMNYNGQTVIHEDSDLSMTIGKDGHGRIDFILLVDLFDNVPIIHSDVEWTVLYG